MSTATFLQQTRTLKFCVSLVALALGVLSPAALPACGSHPEHRTEAPLAEGSYVKKSISGGERIDRWTLRRGPNHTYQLSSLLWPDGDKTTGARLEQFTQFDAGFRMQSFVLKGQDNKQSSSL